MADSYVLLGANVSSSPTPRMMNAAFQALGLDATYRASSVGAAELKAAFARLRASGTRGANVTIPHKAPITSLLDSMDERSSRIGAVNTVKREGESYRGYNTDVDGILGPLRATGRSKIRKASVLGTGGAARAFCEAMHALGCVEIGFLSRDPARAGSFITSMKRAYPEIAMEVASTEDPPSWTPELLFNASPAGANGVPLPAKVSRLLLERPLVFDAVYLPVDTQLVGLAEEAGCSVVYGHEMLLHQALKSFQIWTGRDPPADVMRAALFGSLGVAAD
jgi:shikimate dehydrogenase